KVEKIVNSALLDGSPQAIIQQHSFLEVRRMGQVFRTPLLVAVALLALPTLSPGQTKDSPIWDAVIQKQPFDKNAFRQIKIPAWLQDTVGCGYTLSVMDSKARARAAEHGVTISEMGFVDPFYAYY